jgi:hypothetical protein
MWSPLLLPKSNVDTDAKFENFVFYLKQNFLKAKVDKSLIKEKVSTLDSDLGVTTLDF